MPTGPGAYEMGIIFVMFLGMALGAVLVVLPFWKICTKAGLPGPLALLMIVPIANIILPFYIAFADWPTLRDRTTPTIAITSQKSSSGCLIPGIIVAAIAFFMIPVMGILAAIMLPALARARESARRASCANNLKQVGLSYMMFANESPEGIYPELSNEAGRLMFSQNGSSGAVAVYPRYMTDLDLLLCPSDSYTEPAQEPDADAHPERLIDDHSYFYLGYVVASDSELAAFAEAYRTLVAEGKEFLDDLPVQEGTGTAGGDVILRIREGIGQILIGDPSDPAEVARLQSEIPLMIERPENHIPEGGNVLYLDGHVEFIKYPGQWPMTEQSIAILESLDAL